MYQKPQQHYKKKKHGKQQQYQDYSQSQYQAQYPNEYPIQQKKQQQQYQDYSQPQYQQYPQKTIQQQDSSPIDKLVQEPNEIEFQAQLDLQVEQFFQLCYKSCKSEQDFNEFCRLRDECKKKMYQKNRALQEWRRAETDMKEIEAIIDRESERILEAQKMIRIDMNAEQMNEKAKELKSKLSTNQLKQSERNYFEIYLNLIISMLPYANQISQMEAQLQVLEKKQKAIKEDLLKWKDQYLFLCQKMEYSIEQLIRGMHWKQVTDIHKHRCQMLNDSNFAWEKYEIQQDKLKQTKLLEKQKKITTIKEERIAETQKIQATFNQLVEREERASGCKDQIELIDMMIKFQTCFPQDSKQKQQQDGEEKKDIQEKKGNQEKQSVAKAQPAQLNQKQVEKINNAINPQLPAFVKQIMKIMWIDQGNDKLQQLDKLKSFFEEKGTSEKIKA